MVDRGEIVGADEGLEYGHNGFRLDLNVYYDYIHMMIDWTRLKGFEWDAGNSRKSARKHGVIQVEAEQVFFNEPLLVIADPKHGAMEARFHALGHTDDGRRLHITFTLRQEATLIRVISARDMSRKERARYEQEA